MTGLGKAAVAARLPRWPWPDEDKNAALRRAAAAIRARRRKSSMPMPATWQAALAAKLGGALLDRLRLDDQRVEAIARSMEEIVAACRSCRDGRGAVGSAERACTSSVSGCPWVSSASSTRAGPM